MRGTVAVTDLGWYEFLRRRSPDEVNFWSPSDHRRFRAEPGSLFFFKLKAPMNAIGGFGRFVQWTTLPDWLAWDCFGEGNGVASYEELRVRIARIRQRIRFAVDGPGNIGCILLTDVHFFPPDALVRQPADWHPRTVTSASYDLTVGEGRRIFEESLERARGLPAVLSEETTRAPIAIDPPRERYGTPQLVRPRLGQGTFRVAVTDAYGRACSVTGEHSLPALEAAHIRSYAHEGPHDVRNGLLLRADLHRLFDLGYVTVTPELRLEVSGRLRRDYSNGHSYYPFSGRALRPPAAEGDRPATEFLRWHNENVYRG